jgi:exopolyphosphatase/guanosine-5'-triphosphate,3'-diphosphate pyrophosphatase
MFGVRTWLTDQPPHFTGSLPLGIATGGNMRKLAQRGNKQACYSLTLDRLTATQKNIVAHGPEARVEKLALNPDRAAVILPAAEICNRVMRYGGVQTILVPDVGLREGIIISLCEHARQAGSHTLTHDCTR